MMENNNYIRSLIVGGGAGGLELATKLGDSLRQKERKRILHVS